MDGRMYARPWQGGLLSGGFEKNPKPIFTEGRNQLEIQNMQEDWDHFGNEDRPSTLRTLFDCILIYYRAAAHNYCNNQLLYRLSEKLANLVDFSFNYLSPFYIILEIHLKIIIKYEFFINNKANILFSKMQ